jgi:hypothetical protein
MLRLLQVGTPNHKAGFNACPASGPIVYVSDAQSATINIYKVPFAGQGPCGQLTAASGLASPQGMIVRRHVLYVANTGGLMFLLSTEELRRRICLCRPHLQRRISIRRYGLQRWLRVRRQRHRRRSPRVDLDLAKQSGVLSRQYSKPAPRQVPFLTIQKDGTLYYDDDTFGLYKASCAGGTCGPFSNVGASFKCPGGLRSADGEDVVLDDQGAPGGGALLTYEPPDFSNPGVCTLGGSDPVSFDINRREHHVFVADGGLNEALEYSYPDCKLIGTVPGNSGGVLIDIAKDYPETLH